MVSSSLSSQTFLFTNTWALRAVRDCFTIFTDMIRSGIKYVRDFIFLHINRMTWCAFIVHICLYIYLCIFLYPISNIKISVEIRIIYKNKGSARFLLSNKFSYKRWDQTFEKLSDFENRNYEKEYVELSQIKQCKQILGPNCDFPPI